MSQQDDITALLEAAFRNRQGEIMTALPARVDSYDFASQKAVCTPLVNRRYADGRQGKFGQVNNVPVIFPRSGGASMTFPVREGDTVLLIFSQRSIEAWLEADGGGAVNQEDTRMHDLNDAIAIPGLVPFTATPVAQNNEDVVLQYSGNSVTLKPGGQTVLKATKVTIDAPDVYMTGELVVKGDIYDQDKLYGSSNAHRILYNQHTHSGVEPGGGTTQVTNHPWD